MQRGLFAAVVFFVAMLAGVANAGRKERSAAYDAGLVAQLEAKDPEAAAWFREATALREKGDPSRALELYEKVSEAEPKFTPAIRRRASILARMGKRAEGLELARKAVSMEDTPENQTALAFVLASRLPGRSDVDHAAAAEAIGIMHVVTRERPNDIDDALIWCEVALLTVRLDDLQTCSAQSVRLAPDEPEPHMYAAIAAMARGDRDAARASIETARVRGLAPEQLEGLERAYVETEAPLWRWGRRLLIVVAIWLAGLALLWGVGGALSKRTLELSERMAESRDEHPGSATTRSVYRVLLHLASAYYYASLPLVLLLSVIAGGGAILAFLYIGHIPIYLFVVAITVVLYTVKSVIKSLVIRARDEDPGLAVDLQKHHRLAEMLREVARRVGTRPVDEVYLTAKADIAVFERGGFFRQMQGKTERCLLLGVGVLEGMRLQQFKAILAHEYGHFTNRDTAGGGVALGVRRSLLHTAVGLIQGGAAAWYNPAWLFVVSFQKIFLRISQGASRLQEVMADRVAASAYGPESFASGLQHVIRRSVELDAHIAATLKEVVEAKVPLPNLYAYVPQQRANADSLAAEIEKLVDGEPSPYDSHPKPADRIRWLRELKSSLPPAATDEHEAWSLFENPEAIQTRMTDDIRENLAVRGLVIPAASPAEKAA